MLHIKFLYVFFVIILFFINNIGAQNLNEGKVRINVGQSFIAEFIEGADIVVSKKGIVDIQYIGQGKWKITGMKAGFIIVEAQDLEVDYKKRIFVEVINPKSLSKKELYQHYLHSNIREICKNPTIECADNVISGYTESFMIWIKARKFCAKSFDCIFLLKLSEKAQQQLLNMLKASLGDMFEPKISQFGNPIVMASCDKQENITYLTQIADNLTSGFISFANIPIMCSYTANPEMLILKSKIILMQFENSYDLGLSTNFNSPLEISSDITKQNLIFKLHSAHNNKNIKVIGEPSILLTVGKEGYVHSGSEIQVMYHTDKGDTSKYEGWKKSGIELKAKIENIIYDKYILNYELSIKHKNNSSFIDNQSSFNVSSISSVVNLKLNQPIIVGGADILSEDDSFSSNLSFKDIPIIGPLFKLNSKYRLKSKLYVYLNLFKDNTIHTKY